MYGVMYYQDDRWCDVHFFDEWDDAVTDRNEGISDGYQCVIRRGF